MKKIKLTRKVAIRITRAIKIISLTLIMSGLSLTFFSVGIPNTSSQIILAIIGILLLGVGVYGTNVYDYIVDDDIGGRNI